MKHMFRTILLLAGLLGLPGAGLAQKGKPIVAIYQMQDTANSGQAATLSTMIETAITGTGKFRVIERSFGTLLKEQANAKSGMVTSNRPGRTGKFEGADYLVYGTITSASQSHQHDQGSSIGSRVGNMLTGKMGVGSVFSENCNRSSATLGVDIKITDADSGEERYATHVDQSQRSTSTCSGDAQTDISLLLRAAAEKVAIGLVTTVFPIQVAAVQSDGVLVLNYGEQALHPNDILGLYLKGKAIVDPPTGEVLSYEETKLGLIQVTDVTQRVSKAVPITTLLGPPQVGAIVRPANSADIASLSHKNRRRP